MKTSKNKASARPEGEQKPIIYMIEQRPKHVAFGSRLMYEFGYFLDPKDSKKVIKIIRAASGGRVWNYHVIPVLPSDAGGLKASVFS